MNYKAKINITNTKLYSKNVVINTYTKNAIVTNELTGNI